MHGSLSRQQYLDVLRAESDAFAASCERAGHGAVVPGCPGWTVDDLLWHLTEVHDFWAWVVSGRHASPDAYVQPDRPRGDALDEAFGETTARLHSVLAANDPDTPVWTWSTDRSVGFVVRRVAHETAVHRIDADAAGGVPRAMDAALASDGVDEFLEHFLDSRPDAVAAVGGSVHLHCTDVAGEWTVRPTDSGWQLTREHAKGDAAMRGPALDLLMALWRRVPLTRVDVVGDAEVAARFVAVTRLD